MKINLFLSIIALLLGGLIFYGFYNFGQDLPINAVEAGICTIALIPAMGIRLKNCPRETTMFKTFSILWFFLLFVINSLFVVFNAGISTLVILNGLIFIGGILVLYFIYNTTHE